MVRASPSARSAASRNGRGPAGKPCRQAGEGQGEAGEEQRVLGADPAGREEGERPPRLRVNDRGDTGDPAAERVTHEVRPLEAERATDALDDRRVERVARIEVPRAAHRRALPESGEVERDRAPAGCGDALDDLAPVLRPATDALPEQ